MLVYDIQAFTVHFFPPAGTEDRERRVVSIAELIGMINKAQQRTGPKWKRYYLAHHEREVARQKAYRAAHPDQVQEYNQYYYRNRKQRSAAPHDQARAHPGGIEVLDLIREGWDRLVRFFSGGEEVTTGEVLAESSPSRILVEPLSTMSESQLEIQQVQPDLSRWKVSEYLESPFEKCGRLYIEGDDLVIRSDLDARGFCIPLIDVVDVLDGETVPVLLLSNRTQVGVVRRSISGRGGEVWVEPFLYMSPLARVTDVLEGRARKAAVYVGREG